jgi:hypothetical protein
MRRGGDSPKAPKLLPAAITSDMTPVATTPATIPVSAPVSQRRMHEGLQFAFHRAQLLDGR